MTNAKKIAWWLLYFVAFFSAGFSLVYFSDDKNLIAGLTASLISMLIYTLLITRNFKFLSPLAFFTVPAVSLLILAATTKSTNLPFANLFDEKIFMISTSLLVLFGLVNSVFWSQKQGFKKWVGVIGTALSIFMILVYGTLLPEYYQNFVYTRLYILILLIGSLFLIVKKKRVLGILGIVLVAGAVLFSASAFSEKTYALVLSEHDAVQAFMDPKAKEMFDYYNKKDYGNFCKYCGFTLQNRLVKNPIQASREALGPYVYFDTPVKITRKGGRFYVEYPVKFQNAANLMSVTFQLENIDPDSTIYGFSILDKAGQ